MQSNPTKTILNHYIDFFVKYAYIVYWVKIDNFCVMITVSIYYLLFSISKLDYIDTLIFS